MLPMIESLLKGRFFSKNGEMKAEDLSEYFVFEFLWFVYMNWGFGSANLKSEMEGWKGQYIDSRQIKCKIII